MGGGKGTRLSQKRRQLSRGSLYRHHTTGGWYLRIRWPEEKKFSSIPLVPAGAKTATKEKGLALACAKRLIKQRNGPQQGMEHWIAEYRQWNRLTASDVHVGQNVAIVRGFVSYGHIRQPLEITPAAIQGYLGELKELRSDRTVQRHRNAIHKFCRFLLSRGELESNPAQHVPVRAPAKRPPRFLSEPQIEKLLASKYPERWLRDAVRVGLFSGMRLGEMITLTWADVRDDDIVVGGSSPTKSQDYRIVPMFDDLREVFGDMDRADGFVFACRRAKTWQGLLGQVTKNLPVFGETPRCVGNQWHLLRSTFAVRKAREGATLWQLMAWLGHKTPQTTMRYVNVAGIERM